MSDRDRLKVGVIGVGSMGTNHARIYHELPAVELIGVADADLDRAGAVAERFDTTVTPTDELLSTVDAVSIATPTAHHYELATSAIDHSVHLLVEKPFVERAQHGRELIDRAAAANLTLQVGHVERFNPAVRTAIEIVKDLEVLAVDANRLGPPIDRGIEDGVVLDLMIHDIDVLLALVQDDIVRITSVGTHDGQYVDATIQFHNGVVGSLTSSRVTQRKVRELSITATDRQIELDYLTQSVEIHRYSFPEFVEAGGDIRYRHERVTEYPTVDRGEPLRRELEAFVRAVRTGEPPAADGEAGLEAVEVAHRILEAAEEPAAIAEVQL